MSKGERAGFEKMAREDKVKSKLNPREHEIYTSQGVPYSQVRQEQQDAIRKFENMQQRISQLVEDGFLSNSTSTSYFSQLFAINLFFFFSCFCFFFCSHPRAAILFYGRRLFL